MAFKEKFFSIWGAFKEHTIYPPIHVYPSTWCDIERERIESESASSMVVAKKEGFYLLGGWGSLMDMRLQKMNFIPAIFLKSIRRNNIKIPSTHEHFSYNFFLQIFSFFLLQIFGVLSKNVHLTLCFNKTLEFLLFYGPELLITIFFSVFIATQKY